MLTPKLAQLAEGNERQIAVGRYVRAILAEIKRMIEPDETGKCLAGNVSKQELLPGYFSRSFSLRTPTGTIQILLDTRKADNDNAYNHVSEITLIYVPQKALVTKLTDQNSGTSFSPEYVELRIHLFAGEIGSLQWLFEVMSRGKQGMNEKLWPLIVHGGDDALDDHIGQRHSIAVTSDPGLIDAEEHTALIAKNDQLASAAQINSTLPIIDTVVDAFFHGCEQLTEIRLRESQRTELQKSLQDLAQSQHAA